VIGEKLDLHKVGRNFLPGFNDTGWCWAKPDRPFFAKSASLVGSIQLSLGVDTNTALPDVIFNSHAP